MTNFSENELDERANQRRMAKDFQKALPKFIEGQGGDLYCSLALNRGAQSIESLRRHLSFYFGRIEREFVGARFYKKPKHRRFRGWFFAELIEENAHWHGILHLPDGLKQFPLRKAIVGNAMEERWEKCCPSGNAKVDPVPWRLRGGAFYQTKERWRKDFSDQMVALEDFWPQSKPGRIG